MRSVMGLSLLLPGVTQLDIQITCYGHAGSLLLFGSSQGKLFLFDLDKFPLRLKDNDLLINLLYTDPDGAAVTALSVYESTVGSEKCMEIAYGTQEGVVRIIVQVRVRLLVSARSLYDLTTASRDDRPAPDALSNVSCASCAHSQSRTLIQHIDLW